MNLIDSVWDISKLYASRILPASLVPVVWRHYHLDSRREGERRDPGSIADSTTGERSGFKETLR
jgi:hypothetical protein